MVFVDSSFGYTAESRIEAGRDDLTLKDFKKWWKHTLKTIPFEAWLNIDVLAEYEDEDGLHEMAMYWGNEEMTHDPSIPFC